MRITNFIKHLYISKKKLEHSLHDQHHSNKRLRHRIQELESRLAGVFSRLGLTENDLTNDRLTRPIRLFSKKIHRRERLAMEDRNRLMAQQEADEAKKRLLASQPPPDPDNSFEVHSTPLVSAVPRFKPRF